MKLSKWMTVTMVLKIRAFVAHKAETREFVRLIRYFKALMPFQGKV